MIFTLQLAWLANLPRPSHVQVFVSLSLSMVRLGRGSLGVAYDHLQVWSMQAHSIFEVALRFSRWKNACIVTGNNPLALSKSGVPKHNTSLSPILRSRASTSHSRRMSRMSVSSRLTKSFRVSFPLSVGGGIDKRENLNIPYPRYKPKTRQKPQ